GHHATDQIEQQVADDAEGLLDVVAEDPQRPHVEQQVSQAAVEEHRVQDGHPGALLGEQQLTPRFGQTHLPRDLDHRQRLAGGDLTTDRRRLVEEGDLLVHRGVVLQEEPHERTGGDEEKRDDGPDPGRVYVTDREHERMLCDRARQDRNLSKGGISIPACSSVSSTATMAAEMSMGSSPAHGSDSARVTAAFRSMASGATPSTSDQSRGVATGAFLRARSDQGATAVASGALRSQSMKTRSPRFFFLNSTVNRSGCASDARTARPLANPATSSDEGPCRTFARR